MCACTELDAAEAQPQLVEWDAADGHGAHKGTAKGELQGVMWCARKACLGGDGRVPLTAGIQMEDLGSRASTRHQDWTRDGALAVVGSEQCTRGRGRRLPAHGCPVRMMCSSSTYAKGTKCTAARGLAT